MAIPVFSTVDKWPLRPFDPKCKKFVPFDPVVDEQIRCKVPLWSGNFDELKPELTAEGQGLRFADLPLLTVHDIGQYVIRAAQGGSLGVGTVGTAAHTIVHSLMAAPVEDECVGIARRLDKNPRRVLWFMRDNNAVRKVDGLTRQFIADSLGLSIDDVAEAGKAMRNCGKELLESKDGRNGCWWLTTEGFRVAGHCEPASVIAVASIKRG
jgi:hypothetical protein